MATGALGAVALEGSGRLLGGVLKDMIDGPTAKTSGSLNADCVGDANGAALASLRPLPGSGTPPVTELAVAGITSSDNCGVGDTAATPTALALGLGFAFAAAFGVGDEVGGAASFSCV